MAGCLSDASSDDGMNRNWVPVPSDDVCHSLAGARPPEAAHVW